ncbi:MAG: MBL fold metallo-hydrolase [Betaproteobacteria bacterium]
MRYAVVPVTPFQQNCTVFWCEKTRQAVVIDPGGDLDQILQVVKKENLDLVKVLVTHGHIDHAGAAAELAERFNLPIEGPHEEDRFWIEGMPQQSKMFGFPGVRSFEPTRWLKEGDQVTFGEVTLDVFHCPGHTPGHVVFYHAPSKLAQVGDVIFQGSIGRTDFPKGDYDTLIRSIREKLFTLDDDVEFIPGHGPMSTIGQERRYNPFCGGSYG